MLNRIEQATQTNRGIVEKHQTKKLTQVKMPQSVVGLMELLITPEQNALVKIRGMQQQLQKAIAWVDLMRVALDKGSRAL